MLQRFQQQMLQLCVQDIQATFELICEKLPSAKYQPIQNQGWGKVMYLWGPAGELWHITELNPYS